MTTNTSQKTIVLITSPQFAKGYHLGRTWYFHGEAELPIDDLYIIANIAGYCEKGSNYSAAKRGGRRGEPTRAERKAVKR